MPLPLKLLTAPLLLLALAACGGDDDDGGSVTREREQRLVQAMIDEGATEEQARCVVDALGDDAERLLSADDSELGGDELRDFAEAVASCIEE